MNFSDPTIRFDCHIPGSIIPSLYYNFIQPLKALIIEKKLRRNEKYLEYHELSAIGEFIFFPLHFEPEVSLQVFGRHYQNQIELVRNIAMSAPVEIKVVVKEHPRSIGYRPFSYYRKLLEIPNVYLADPFIKANNIVQNCTLVSVIAGSIGLEAAILQKPVITFGEVPYNVLPKTMVRPIKDLSSIGGQIIDLKKNYKYCQKSLEKYIYSFVKGSVPLDFYTAFLSKKNRYSENADNLGDNQRIQGGYDRLVNYCLSRFKDNGLSF
jgi:hypothetical protein